MPFFLLEEGSGIGAETLNHIKVWLESVIVFPNLLVPVSMPLKDYLLLLLLSLLLFLKDFSLGFDISQKLHWHQLTCCYCDDSASIPRFSSGSQNTKQRAITVYTYIQILDKREILTLGFPITWWFANTSVHACVKKTFIQADQAIIY